MPETYRLISRSIADLPTLSLAPLNDAADAPLAIILHGLSGSKEWTLPTLYAFARQGVSALALDLPLHGERSGVAWRDRRLENDYLGTMGEIIEGATSDITRLLDTLGVAQAAIHGISLGGYVAFSALVADPRLSIGSIAMGSPDWLEVPRGMGLYPGHPFYDEMAARSPLEQGVNVYPMRPLLMQHGDQDETVSIAGVRALYDRLKPHYQAAPDRLELVVYPGLGHHYTEEMIQRAAGWTARFLASV